jgi:predicted transcriptional regulator
MPATKKTATTTWATVRKHLKGWEPEAMLSLVKDLYDSLGRGLDDLCELVKEQGREAWEVVRDRLDKLAEDTKGIGWGYADDIRYSVDDLREEFDPTDDD